MKSAVNLIQDPSEFTSFEKDIQDLYVELDQLIETDPMYSFKRATLIEAINLKLKHKYNSLSVHEQLELLLHTQRPDAIDYIQYIASDFCPIFNDTPSVCIAGIAKINSMRACTLGTVIGKNHSDRSKHNMGIIDKIAVDKIVRCIEFAEKLDLPVFFFVDSAAAASDKSLNKIMRSKNLFIYILGQAPSVFLLAKNKYALEHSIIHYSDQSISVKDTPLELILEQVGGAHRNIKTVLESVKNSVGCNLYGYMYGILGNTVEA